MTRKKSFLPAVPKPALQPVPAPPGALGTAPFYWAYGSNLNVAGMARRCPGAEQVGPLTLENGVLRFRHHADVCRKTGYVIQGGLWRITPACEAALDRYEGAGKYYEKRYLTLRVQGAVAECLYYKMLGRGIMPPSEDYLDCIVEGYKDFGLDLELLEEAVVHSWGSKNKTPMVRARYRKRGRPTLARALPFEFPGEEA